METVMLRVLGQRIWAVLCGHKTVRLNMAARAGGYAIVTSPDLPGFSRMLTPNDMRDTASIRAALQEPLTEFIVAEYNAFQAKRKSMRVHDIRCTTSSNMIAELCPS